MSVYENIFSLISQYIYGNELNEFSELVCTLISTIGCVLISILPFLIVWRVCRLIMGD